MSPFEGLDYPDSDGSEATTPVADQGHEDCVLDLSNWTFETPLDFQDSLTRVSSVFCINCV